MSSLVRTTDAASEPVSLATAKLWCRVDNTSEDAIIQTLISAARQQVEADTGRQLGTQTWTWTLDQRRRLPKIHDAVEADLLGFPIGEWPWFVYDRQPALRSGVAPVTGITSVTYRLAGADVSYDTSKIRLGGDADLIFTEGLPISDELKDALTIVLEVGGTAPAWAEQAIQMLVVHWYENRVPVQMGTGRGIVEIPLAYQIITGAHKRVTL